MATGNSYNYVSPGLYRSPTGQVVRRSQMNKALGTTPQTTPQGNSPYTTSFRNAGKGFYRGADGSLISGNQMTSSTNTFNSLANRFAGLKQTDAQYNQIGQRLRDLGTQFGLDYNKVLGNNWQPYYADVKPKPAPKLPKQIGAAKIMPTTNTPQAPQAAASTGQGFNYEQSPMTKALVDAMKGGLNTMQAYEPKFYEGSPLYQFQKQQGQKDLEKLMAARGLTGSGAEVQANSDFLSKLGAEESEKARQYAVDAANRQTQAMQFLANFDQEERQAQLDQWNKNTDRRINMQEFDANRRDARAASMQNFLTSILGMQAQNPIAGQAQSGLNSMTDLSRMINDMTARFGANNYTRSYGSGGGTPPPPPPSRVGEIANINSNYGDRAGNNDLWNGIFSILGGM
jgi:hypothetical protein